jgi:dTDP-4-amino-4,6-dideoxygalactose transaminase
VISVFGARLGADEVDALTPSVLGGWMGMGPRVAEFEGALEHHLGAPVVLVDSGSNALHVALTALDLPPRSDVVVPALTWVACANAVILAGHRPVFADVDLATQNVTAAAVEQVRTPRTAAVMVVHYAGKPADVPGIAALGLPVIEDAAHAIDSSLHGRACGTLGAVGIYSFDAVKNVATPDGGGVTSPDPALLERARGLRYCGIGSSGFARSAAADGRWWESPPGEAFPRALPNDVSASIGLVQLRRLAANQAWRRAIWERYQAAFDDLGWLVRPVDPAAGERHSYFTYLVRVHGGRRDALARALLDRGIYTTLRYHPLHLTGTFGPPERALPACELLAEEALNLPLHPALSDADVELVIDAVRAAA